MGSELIGMWFVLYESSGGVFLHGCVKSMVNDACFLAQMIHPEKPLAVVPGCGVALVAALEDQEGHAEPHHQAR